MDALGEALTDPASPFSKYSRDAACFNPGPQNLADFHALYANLAIIARHDAAAHVHGAPKPHREPIACFSDNALDAIDNIIMREANKAKDNRAKHLSAIAKGRRGSTPLRPAQIFAELGKEAIESSRFLKGLHTLLQNVAFSRARMMLDEAQKARLQGTDQARPQRVSQTRPRIPDDTNKALSQLNIFVSMGSRKRKAGPPHQGEKEDFAPLLPVGMKRESGDHALEERNDESSIEDAADANGGETPAEDAEEGSDGETPIEDAADGSDGERPIEHGRRYDSQTNKRRRLGSLSAASIVSYTWNSPLYSDASSQSPGSVPGGPFCLNIDSPILHTHPDDCDNDKSFQLNSVKDDTEFSPYAAIEAPNPGFTPKTKSPGNDDNNTNRKPHEAGKLTRLSENTLASASSLREPQTNKSEADSNHASYQGTGLVRPNTSLPDGHQIVREDSGIPSRTITPPLASSPDLDLHADLETAIRTLQPGGRLSSTAITEALEMLLPNAHLHAVLTKVIESDLHTGQHPAFRRTRKSISCFINSHGHWVAVLISPEDNTFQVYDPLPQRQYQAWATGLVRSFLSSRSVKTGEDVVGWRAVEGSLPSQRNEYDCGILTLSVAALRAHRLDVPSRLIPDIWRRCVLKLLRTSYSRTHPNQQAEVNIPFPPEAMMPKMPTLDCDSITSHSMDEVTQRIQAGRSAIARLNQLREECRLVSFLLQHAIAEARELFSTARRKTEVRDFHRGYLDLLSKAPPGAYGAEERMAKEKMIRLDADCAGSSQIVVRADHNITDLDAAQCMFTEDCQAYDMACVDLARDVRRYEDAAKQSYRSVYETLWPVSF